MRSDRIGYAPQYGVLLRELEDKVEIAKVQEQILNAITNVRVGHANREEAIAALNCNLYDVTQVRIRTLLNKQFCCKPNLSKYIST